MLPKISSQSGEERWRMVVGELKKVEERRGSATSVVVDVVPAEHCSSKARPRLSDSEP